MRYNPVATAIGAEFLDLSAAEQFVSEKSTDMLIVGGGVIGLSLALELARKGATVRLLERGDFGREASWAGAGILPPGNLAGAKSAEAKLRALSHRLWTEWSQRLREETGVDNGYTRCGGLSVVLGRRSDHLEPEIDGWRNEGVAVEPLAPPSLSRIEPALNREVAAAYRLDQLGQVRNPRHLKALVAACAKRGVELHAGQPVNRFVLKGGRATGVVAATGRYSADAVCIAGGAWSAGLLDGVCDPPVTTPVRGQIVLLSLPSPAFSHVVESGRCYLVPRPDGRVLVGATEEWVGFDKRNTASAIAKLIDFAVQIVPQLADAHVERTWAGLRPGTPDGLPYLGRIAGVENLYLAAGHFRSGLQMSPGTAAVLSELMLGREPSIPLDGFDPHRRIHVAKTLH